MTEGDGSLKLLNRAGSHRAVTQFVLSPRHVTVVSFVILGDVEKGESLLIQLPDLFSLIFLKKQHEIV